MLTQVDAQKVAEEFIRKIELPDDPYIIIDECTIDKEWGWVFIYNSKKYVDTGDSCYALMGNGPLMVNKHTREIYSGDTIKDVEFYIAEYEATLK